jgi:hypothetical protein
MFEAHVALAKALQMTNRNAWNLRPDNLYLLIHLLISDLMLSLNFHGSVVEVTYTHTYLFLRFWP